MNALRHAGVEVLERGSTGLAQSAEKGSDENSSPAPGLLLQELARRDIRGVLVEAGFRVNGSFLREGLVDKVALYIAESELGADALPFATGGGSPFALQQILTSVEHRDSPTTAAKTSGSPDTCTIAGHRFHRRLRHGPRRAGPRSLLGTLT